MKIILLALALVLLSVLTFLTFNIQPVKSALGSITIRAEGIVEGTTEITTDDNTTYTFTNNIFNQSIVVERDNIVVDGAGCTLQGTGSGSGIILSGRNNVTIKNMKIKEFECGIWLNMSSSNSMCGNNVEANNDIGILLEYDSNHNSICGNNIKNNWDGIWLEDSSNNSISGNSMSNNDWGIVLRDFSNYNDISANNVTNNEYGVVLYESLKHNSISGNNIKNNVRGVRLGGSLNNSISGNKITANNDYGILLIFSSNCNSISGNNVTANNGHGIRLGESSNNNSIHGNNIADNGDGIKLSESSNNSISKNNIVTNNNDGIYVIHSPSNTMSENNITKNEVGIRLLWSSNNTIYHNNFVDNNEQVSIYESTNVWDDSYPSGGNYWSNYTGADLYSGQYQNEVGSDGIGDTSHDIDADNQDRYPLTGPISFFNAWTWDETTYYVHTASNSTVSDFHFSRDNKLISFSVNGTVGTVGFSRVAIPTELMWCDALPEWNVTINGIPPTYLKAMEDADCTYLYFNYSHSIQEVQIEGTHAIPESPVEEEEVPFWMQWWLWAIVAVGIVALAGAVYFLKKRKPTTPTPPTPPRAGQSSWIETFAHDGEGKAKAVVETTESLAQVQSFIRMIGKYSKHVLTSCAENGVQ